MHTTIALSLPLSPLLPLSLKKKAKSTTTHSISKSILLSFPNGNLSTNDIVMNKKGHPSLSRPVLCNEFPMFFESSSSIWHKLWLGCDVILILTRLANLLRLLFGVQRSLHVQTTRLAWGVILVPIWSIDAEIAPFDVDWFLVHLHRLKSLNVVGRSMER